MVRVMLDFFALAGFASGALVLGTWSCSCAADLDGLRRQLEEERGRFQQQLDALNAALSLANQKLADALTANEALQADLSASNAAREALEKQVEELKQGAAGYEAKVRCATVVVVVVTAPP